MTEEFVLPRGVDQETYDKAKEIILSGYDADQSPDEIKSAMFTNSIPFSKLARLWKNITTSEGLVVDLPTIRKNIKEEVEGYSFSFKETHSELMDVAEELTGEVKGATKGRVVSAIRTFFTESDEEFPKKPAKARSGMGVINRTMINVFAENTGATIEELREALEKVVKTAEHAEKYSKQNYKMLFAIANGMTDEEVMSK